MNNILKDIDNGKYDGMPKERPDKSINKKYQRKKNWYKIGEVILWEHKVKLHKESQVAAQRTYNYYSVDHGNWEGPSPRELSKINKEEFERLLAERRQGGLDITLDQVRQILDEHLQEWNPEQEIDGTISF
jgi:hypothetical protein